MTFSCRNIASQIWWLPCGPHRSEWPKTCLGAVYSSLHQYEQFSCFHFYWFKISQHDDVIEWKHFPRCWPFVREIYLVAEISRLKFDDYRVIRTGASDLKLFGGRCIVRCTSTSSLAAFIFIDLIFLNMMTSSNGNIFRVAGHLYGKFIGQRRIPLTTASDAELWCFLWSAPQ